MEEKRQLPGPRSRLLLPLAGIAALAVLAGATYGMVRRDGSTDPATPAAQAGTGSGSATGTATGTGTPTASPTSATATAGTSAQTASRKPAQASRVAGWPDASNTGVPKGTRLRKSGSITVKKAGTVIDRMDVNGCILILASNVTIRRTRVHGPTCAADHGIDIGYGGVQKHRGILIEDVEVDGEKRHARGAGIGNMGFTCRRCNIHGHARGIHTDGDVVVEDSYLHDLAGTATSETVPFQTNGGSHIVLRHNSFEQNDVPTAYTALALLGEFSPIDDVLVERNLFNGGGYCVYGGSVESKRYPLATRVRFLNNAFGRKLHRKCGTHGPVVYFDAKGSGNKWSGNYWADTKQPVVP